MAQSNAGFRYTGTGIYTVGEAAKLSGVSTGRIRRWLRGYQFSSPGGVHQSPPVWQPQLPEIDGKLALGFLDLMEVRFVDAFLGLGVSWHTLRLAAAKARALFDSTHPFSTRRFKTDGRYVFAEVQNEAGEPALLELVRSQQYFYRIVAPCLRGVDFDAEEPTRWWPMGRSRWIVIDPRRSFGQPIVAKSGVPTAVLARAAGANSIAEVSRWYQTDIKAVQMAIEYQKQLEEKKAA
ncbi:MAG: hypothetical protein HY718_21130 [Planctomycetes bacterium]|nr:hypothetical protein [Planctomycetota bacterium]